MKNLLIFIFAFMAFTMTAEAQRHDISRFRPSPDSVGQTIVSVANGSGFKWAKGDISDLGISGIESFFTSNDSTFAVTSQDDTLLVSVAAASDPGYREYVALLTQVGTNAPVATVLVNTLGYTVTWDRYGTGLYGTSSVSAENGDKVAVLATNQAYSGDAGTIIRASWSGEDNAVIVSTEISTTATDGQLSDPDGFYKSTIIIRIYD